MLSIRKDSTPVDPSPPSPQIKHELSLVQKGLVTFMAQGQSDRTLRIRHPKFRGMKDEDNESGILIGRGYNLKFRTAAQVLEELKNKGIPDNVRTTLSQAAGLSRTQAAQFYREHTNLSISRLAQVKLFNQIYNKGSTWQEPVDGEQITASVDSFVEQARHNYEHWTMNGEFEDQRTSWDSLHEPIQEILIDFVYQGFTKGPRPMVKGMRNNFGE